MTNEEAIISHLVERLAANIITYPFLILGIWAAIKGKVRLTRHRGVEGRKAKAVGAIFICASLMSIIFYPTLYTLGFNLNLATIALVFLISTRFEATG